jgi:tRNA A37 threonylcarbamoyladenosine modification protein TsaB
MRVLAIDTALEACSAAVLDLGRGGIIASETLPMARGHAEAIMPMIARVMDLAETEFAALDRDRGDHRSLAASPAAGGHRGGARHRAHVRQAGDRALDALGFAAQHIAEDDSTNVVAAIDARHEQRLSADLRHRRRTLVAPRIAPIREAVRAASTAPVRVVGSAPI